MGKLKQSEKNILYLLVMVVIIVLAYFLGYRNISDKNEQVKKEVASLKITYNNLVDLSARAEGFKKDTVTYNEDIEKLYAKYDTGNSQEYTVKFLEGIENQTNVWIKNASLPEATRIFTFGNIKSSNPANPGAPVYTTDYIGVNATSNVSFEGSYEDTKEMIKFILENEYKCLLESFSVSYSAEEDKITGSFSVSQFSIEGADRVFGGANINNESFGTENIFSSGTFNPSGDDITNGENIRNDHDIYMVLSSAESEVGAFELGLQNDSTGATKIKATDNKVQDVTIRITGSNGQYKISYKVGNKTYPTTNYAAGKDFTPGNMLSMLVVATEKDGSNDKSGANLTIVNETDMTLYIKVSNDDSTNPRFAIKHKSGDIKIYE